MTTGTACVSAAGGKPTTNWLTWHFHGVPKRLATKYWVGISMYTNKTTAVHVKLVNVKFGMQHCNNVQNVSVNYSQMSHVWNISVCMTKLLKSNLFDYIVLWIMFVCDEINWLIDWLIIGIDTVLWCCYLFTYLRVRLSVVFLHEVHTLTTPTRCKVLVRVPCLQRRRWWSVPTITHTGQRRRPKHRVIRQRRLVAGPTCGRSLRSDSGGKFNSSVCLSPAPRSTQNRFNRAWKILPYAAPHSDTHRPAPECLAAPTLLVFSRIFSRARVAPDRNKAITSDRVRGVSVYVIALAPLRRSKDCADRLLCDQDDCTVYADIIGSRLVKSRSSIGPCWRDEAGKLKTRRDADCFGGTGVRIIYDASVDFLLVVTDQHDGQTDWRTLGPSAVSVHDEVLRIHAPPSICAACVLVHCR